MAQQFEESLLQAIKTDNVKAFNAFNEKARCGTYRLGRFPVLSLFYLYKSRKLISAYEKKFLEITSYEVLNEPVEVSKKFSCKAGKCLRLYLNEIVSPLEMLLVLDKTKRLKRIYPLIKQSPEINERLKSIYFIRYSLNIKFNDDGIIIDRRPLSYREKKHIATICLCSALAVTVAVGVPVTTVALIPKPVEGEVTKLSHIDFSSKKEYTLKRDLVIPDNFSVNKVNCKIIGEGKKLIIRKGAKLGELNGKISDLVIESSGEPIFTSVSENAIFENVTVNVSTDITAAEGTALVTRTNYGTIDGITVNVSGRISAVASSSESSEEIAFGGIVHNNNYKYNTATNTVYRGIIKNCTVNYSQFEIAGKMSANASFGGITAINNGYVQDCIVTGKIVAETFDIAGVCSINNGMISGSVNAADLVQTSADSEWNPVVCGIVLNNSYAVEGCENRGSISSVSDSKQSGLQKDKAPTAMAAGIAYVNRSSTASPYIKSCINYGNIECGAEVGNVYAAGVCLSTSGRIDSCKNGGTISINAGNDYETYVGGIAALSYSSVYSSVNEGAVFVTGSDSAYVGGIVAYTYTQVSTCYSSGDITVNAKKAYVGGILGYSEVTSYGIYVYCGTVDYCISENRLKVYETGNAQIYAGGITGCMGEAGFGSGDSMQYFGGAITNCYFTGECSSDISYFGNVVGACGVNTYESNSYTSGFIEYHNFENNYYPNNSFGAFGTVLTDDDSYDSHENKGATSRTIDEIRNSEEYKSILNKLGK